MFIGHYGVALALKKADTKISLGWLFVATQLVDIVWGPLILLGLEQVEIVPGLTQSSPLDFVHYPYTHSLLAFLVWSLAAYLVVRFLPIKTALTKGKVALLLGVAVFSHFVLDLLVHRPDLPLAGTESAKMGLGLWDHIWAAYLLELAIFLIGLTIYMKSSRAADKLGQIGWPLFALFLLVMNAVNLWGPPPPSAQTIGWSVLISYPLLALVAHWLGKHRPSVST
ncbi:MAG: hypothetical protein P1R58_12135 [bacterium]|nr:hypothetical protein [bacterium]